MQRAVIGGVQPPRDLLMAPQGGGDGVGGARCHRRVGEHAAQSEGDALRCERDFDVEAGSGTDLGERGECGLDCFFEPFGEGRDFDARVRFGQCRSGLPRWSTNAGWPAQYRHTMPCRGAVTATRTSYPDARSPHRDAPELTFGDVAGPG